MVIMSRWYQPRYLSKSKKAEIKRLREADEAFRLWQGEAREAARLKREEYARVDHLVGEGQTLGLDRAGIAARTGLSLFVIALSERRLAGVTT